MAIEKTATPNDPDKVVNGVAAEIEIEVQAPVSYTHLTLPTICSV